MSYRVLYPKVAKKGAVLDDFLQRRLQLKNLEERRIELKSGKVNNHQTPTAVSGNDKTDGAKKINEGESDTKTSITSDLAEKTTVDKEQDCKKFVEQSKKSIWSWIAKLKEASKHTTTSPNQNPCYVTSVTCKSGLCYSPTCSNRRQIIPGRRLKSPIKKSIYTYIKKLLT